MSRIAKTLNIEGRKEYVIKELKNSHSKELVLILMDIEKISDYVSLSEFFQRNLSRVLGWCSDIPLEEFEDFSHSETALVWETFKTINPFFLTMMQTLQVSKRMLTLTNLGLEGFMMGFAKSLPGLLEPGIQTPGNTAGVLRK